MRSWLSRLGSRGLAAQSAALALAVLAAYAVVAPVAGSLGGTAGLAAAATAAGVCLLGAQWALVVSHRCRDPKHVWRSALTGMLPRMGIPFVLGLIFQLRGGMLAEAGLLVYLVVFYPVALWAETILCLAAGDRAARPGQASRNVAL